MEVDDIKWIFLFQSREEFDWVQNGGENVGDEIEFFYIVSEFVNTLYKFIRGGMKGKPSGYDKNLMPFLSQAARLFIEDSFGSSDDAFNWNIGNKEYFHS